jgi:PRTRC genetic system protein D
MNNKIQVAAIDVGYGHTKYVIERDKQMRVDVFPSIAIDVVASEEALGFVGRSDIRKVMVARDKPLVWVGPDTNSKMSGTSNARELSDKYCLSDQYLAFVRGALTYMNVTQVQVLQLGLPLTTLATHRKALQAKMVGEHQLFDAEGNQYTCNVKSVGVSGQPVAALANFMNLPEAPDLDVNDKVLLIDFGYFTTDWVVIDHNLDIVLERSGAEIGGMSKVIAKIFEGLQDEVKRTLPPAIQVGIDHAMTNGQSQVRIRDTMYNFQKHIELTDTVAKSYMRAVSNKVGMIDDMRKIVICGGGAAFMRRHVQAMFGSDGLVMPSDSREAIAKGLHVLGSATARQAAYV